MLPKSKVFAYKRPGRKEYSQRSLIRLYDLTSNIPHNFLDTDLELFLPLALTV